MATGDSVEAGRELAAEIGKRVFQARVTPRPGKRKGFTQKALAALSGVPQGRISEIESGLFDARALVTIRELAHALGISEGELVFPRQTGESPRIADEPDEEKTVPTNPRKRRQA